MDPRERPSRRHGTNQTPRSRQPLSLSIRTANQTTPPAIQQATPPSHPYPIYPLPIPKEKEARALELYIRYWDAKLKEKIETSQIEPKSTASHRGGYHLAVPGPPTAQSVASYASSKFSLATSAYDAITDLSSVVSFEDEDEPTSAVIKMEGELMSFDGKLIKQRRRKKLSPVARAKAALVRHLGSCWVCRSRRVKCPLEHHDMDLLESLRQQRLDAQRPKAHNHSSSSISSSSQQTATSVHGWSNTGPGFSQNETLIGVGGIGGDLNAALGNLDTSQLDIQSPGGVAYGEISLDIPTPVPRSLVAPATSEFGLGPNPYSTYLDGQMFVLGAQRQDGFFYCQHLGSSCPGCFVTDEELQDHFEFSHFSFTRIRPAHRFFCVSCTHFNNDIVDACENCEMKGTIELWIYGNYILNPTFQRHAPDALDIANYTPTTMFSSTYATSNVDQWDNSGNFDGYTNTNTDQYDYHGGGGGNFGGSQYEYQPSNHSSYSTNHFQGNTFNGNNSRQLSSSKQATVATYFNICQSQARTQTQTSQHSHKRDHLLFLLICLLPVIILSFTHNLIFAKSRLLLLLLAREFGTSIQLLGFLGMLVSSRKGISTKMLMRGRASGGKCHPRYSHYMSRKPNNPFHNKCGQTIPATFILGQMFS